MKIIIMSLILMTFPTHCLFPPDVTAARDREITKETIKESLKEEEHEQSKGNGWEDCNRPDIEIA